MVFTVHFWDICEQKHARFIFPWSFLSLRMTVINSGPLLIRQWECSAWEWVCLSAGCRCFITEMWGQLINHLAISPERDLLALFTQLSLFSCSCQLIQDNLSLNNSTFFCINKQAADAQNAALAHTPANERVLLYLYWLSVSFIIDFKILLLVFRALTGLAPSYIQECQAYYAAPNQVLRLSST